MPCWRDISRRSWSPRLRGSPGKRQCCCLYVSTFMQWSATWLMPTGVLTRRWRWRQSQSSRQCFCARQSVGMGMEQFSQRQSLRQTAHPQNLQYPPQRRAVRSLPARQQAVRQPLPVRSRKEQVRKARRRCARLREVQRPADYLTDQQTLTGILTGPPTG